MERSEPSLIPEWLKGASGNTLASPHPLFYQEDGGNLPLSRPRASHQVVGGITDYDSPRSTASSERSSFSSSRRSHGSSSVDRPKMDRENHSQAWLNPSLVRSSSFKQGYATQIRDKEREGNRTEVRECVQDGERSVWSKEADGLSGISLEERKRERERLENGRSRLIITGISGRDESDVKLRRPQSMGLSPRLFESNAWKQTEGVTPMPSASTQKAAFERNFPSLGVDDKSLGAFVSSVSSPIASPRPLWQSPLRSELGRASSPGLIGGMGSPSLTPLSINNVAGGSELWNSVLVETLSSSDNMQSISLGMSALSCSTSTPSYAPSSGSFPATSGTVLNMAEALSQGPPRVRTPPQSSADSQRLEELALKQSRQLIPMTPSLPKTKSLSDKGKLKTTRTVDLGRPSSASKPDLLKQAQGKLLVLKANKDGVLANTALKSEGGIIAQSSPHGPSGTGTLPSLSIGGSAPHTKPHGRKGSHPNNGITDSLAGVRSKDFMEDKRLIQAQNRSDFFNTLRRKAAGHGSALTTSNSDSQKPDGVRVPSEAAVLEETATSDHVASKTLGGGADCGFHFHSNGVTDSQRMGLITDGAVCVDCNSSAMECTEEVVSVDSEEEEAAFMRSLGWEENAEDSELTEEEINAFYQMRDKRKMSGNEGRGGDVRVEPCNKNSEVCLSSSESESDDELHA